MLSADQEREHERERRAAELGQRALALRREGKARDAVQALREAVRLAPRHAGLLGNLGNALFASGERAAAIVALERACRLEPGSGQLAYNLGKALLDEGRLGPARVAFERALASGGVEAHARVNLGRTDEIEGRLEAAAEHWRRAAELAPRLARPHYLLARVGHLLDRAPLEALAAATDTPASERVEAHFGLGHALEREGRFAEAFEHFARGNQEQRALIPRFDPAGHERELERIVRTFDADFFRALSPAHASEAPLFVVGLPRSGTTLVESILAAHPAVAARGERVEIDRLARSWRSRGYPERAQEISLAERHAAAEAYLRALDLPPDVRRATDKLPGNYVHLGLIAMLFPNARVVHCRRDPLDTALSLFCQLFEGGALAFSYDLEHIARVIRAYRRLMEHWRACLPLALLELDYEDLVRDVERGSRELVRFAGLEWDERCLARSRDAAVHTASAWRVRAPVDGNSVGRWRRYAGELAPLRAALAPMTRSRFVSAWGGALAVLVASSGASLLVAQHRYLPAQPIHEKRAIYLGERTTNQLTVDRTGTVLLGSSGPALVSVALDDSVGVQAFKDLGYYGPSGTLLAISRDGALVAGSGASDAIYFEGMWWGAREPLSPHAIGGNISQVLGIENTPTGRRMVGDFDGQPWDSRPGPLPKLPNFSGGRVEEMSADGRVYCGMLTSGFQRRAVRWVDRVPQLLDDPAGHSRAWGMSDDGSNFAGQTWVVDSNSPAVWLAQDGLSLRTLRAPDGNPLHGLAWGVLDDGFAFGEAYGPTGFGWVWHPSSGTDSVTRFEDWLVSWNMRPIHIESVRGVHETRKSYHFSLQGQLYEDSWYVQTPKR